MKNYYSRQGEEVDVSAETLYTMRESLIRRVGVRLLAYGVPVVLLLLLVIPAINIMTLNVANSNKQSEEIAIRRAIGAPRSALFFQMMTENLILVVVGVFFGLLLFFPMVYWIEEVCVNGVTGGTDSLVTDINSLVILGGIFPLMLVFTLLTGGCSACLAVRKNMAVVLKGGAE